MRFKMKWHINVWLSLKVKLEKIIDFKPVNLIMAYYYYIVNFMLTIIEKTSSFMKNKEMRMLNSILTII